MHLRKQLTLFVDERYSAEIEKIRKKYNPVQFHLIKSHVTLCRENEIADLFQIKANLQSLNFKPVTLFFDGVERFSNGKGVYMPAIQTNTDYHALRKTLLKGTLFENKFSLPHITLMHPKNATCTTAIFHEIEQAELPQSIAFEKISLIEQHNGGKWEITDEFQL